MRRTQTKRPPPGKKRRRRKAAPPSTPATATAPPNRKTTEIDLDQVTELRRKGLESIAEIARYMGIPKQTMLNGTHAMAVKEAFEKGTVLAKVAALDQYEEAISGSNGNLTGLLIFKMKQFGWTDRVQHAGTIEVTDGARDRIRDAIEKLREKWRKEGKEGAA